MVTYNLKNSYANRHFYSFGFKTTGEDADEEIVPVL